MATINCGRIESDSGTVSNERYYHSNDMTSNDSGRVESDSNVVSITPENLMLYEVVRRSSFLHWPREHIISGASLAADGFQYRGEKDKV